MPVLLDKSRDKRKILEQILELGKKSRVPFLVEPLIYCIGITGLELYTAKSRIV